MNTKLLTGICIAAISTGVFAAGNTPNSCPFTDYMHISGPATMLSIDGSSGPIKATNVSSKQFNITSTSCDTSNPGTVTVTLGTDASNSCQMVIKDGAYEMDPTVQSTNCKGSLQYMGIDHDRSFPPNYDYTLKFASK